MEIANNFYRTSIKALIFDENKRFLLCKEENGHWDFPGGAMNFGENAHEALRREMMEETGLILIDIDVRPKYFSTFINDKKYWSTNIFFEARIKSLEIIPSDECIEARYFSREEALRENIYPSMIEIIKMIENEK
ncbi:MAG: NUDIX hydrolase [Candidatus Shapirobacteria bacterium]|jgi:ADP-ribose pyrophosphatase YjhB (NUDIX family)